jgi:hypothetical protein
MHHRSLFWLDTGILIKSGGVKLVLWAQTSPLSEMMQSLMMTIYGHTMQSLPITTDVVSSNSVHGEVYSIQLYVIKFGSDLRWVNGFLCMLRCPPPIKLTATI